MNTAFDYVSLKHINAITIDREISEKESYIKSRLEWIFIYIYIAKTVGEELINLASLKEAKIIIESADYKAYEASGKKVDYESFLQQL